MLRLSLEFAYFFFALANKFLGLASDNHAGPAHFFASLRHHPATGLFGSSFYFFPYSLYISLNFAQLLFDIADPLLNYADRLLIQTSLVNSLADLLPYPT